MSGSITTTPPTETTPTPPTGDTTLTTPPTGETTTPPTGSIPTPPTGDTTLTPPTGDTTTTPPVGTTPTTPAGGTTTPAASDIVGIWTAAVLPPSASGTVGPTGVPVGTNTIQFLTDGTYQDYSEGEDGQYEVGGRYVFDGSTLTFEIDAYAPNGAGTTPPQGYNVVSSVPASLSTDGTTLTINGEDFTKQTTTTPGGTPVGFANVLPPDTLPPLTVLPTTA